MSKLPLSILLEKTKGRLVSAMNEALSESGLPAYLMEGLVLEVLSDVRMEKAHELAMDMSELLEQKEAAERQAPEQKEGKDD